MAKLLIVEDSEVNRTLLLRRLEKAGYEILTAGDGKEALAAARQHQPELILMDLEMPVMDGRTAIRALRTDPKTFRIPIIVLTAHASLQDVAGAAEEGCEAYETKPIVIRRLLERIEEVLRGAATT